MSSELVEQVGKLIDSHMMSRHVTGSHNGSACVYPKSFVSDKGVDAIIALVEADVARRMLDKASTYGRGPLKEMRFMLAAIGIETSHE